MAARKIEKVLRKALLQNGKMEQALYEFELEELVEELIQSLRDDNNDYIFAVTEHSGDAAMVLIEKSGEIYINEQAREKLKKLWPAAYENNMKQFIPFFAKQLEAEVIPINGVNQIKE